MLINEIIESNNKLALPVLSQFAQLPSKNSVFPQSEIVAFVRSTSFLAHHSYPLPAVEIVDERDYCFAAFRKIIYAMYSHQPEAKAEASNAWQVFGEPVTQQAMVALYEIVVDVRGHEAFKIVPSKNIVKVYPKEILNLVRQFMSLGGVLDFSQSYRTEEATQFAFYLIGELGNRSDLGRLRELSRLPKFSLEALSAIKSIEGK